MSSMMSASGVDPAVHDWVDACEYRPTKAKRVVDSDVVIPDIGVRMRVYGVLVMRNEVDIIESWVRYHIQLFDRLMIMDHFSVDGSGDLVRELASEGLPLDLVMADALSYDQSRLVTWLARRAAEHGADWVFPLDADEFLNPGGAPTVADLEGSEPDGPFSIPWRTYVPTTEDRLDETNVPLRMNWRLEHEIRRYDKVAVPRRLLQSSTTVIGMGSHNISASGEVIEPGSCPSGWSIGHFPVRSAEQLARKVFVGWISVLADPNRGPNTAFQWRKWFHVLIDSDLSALDPAILATAYLADDEDLVSSVPLVRDPLPSELCSFEMKSTPRAEVSPLKALALAAESLAAELAIGRDSG